MRERLHKLVYDLQQTVDLWNKEKQEKGDKRNERLERLRNEPIQLEHLCHSMGLIGKTDNKHIKARLKHCNRYSITNRYQDRPTYFKQQYC